MLCRKQDMYIKMKSCNHLYYDMFHFYSREYNSLFFLSHVNPLSQQKSLALEKSFFFFNKSWERSQFICSFSIWKIIVARKKWHNKNKRKIDTKVNEVTGIKWDYSYVDFKASYLLALIWQQKKIKTSFKISCI